MSEKLFKTVRNALQECNGLPEDAKEILKTTNNSINDLDENDSKRLWILLHDFIKETFEDISDAEKLITCYQSILNLVDHVIKSTEDIICVYEHNHLLKTIMIFQSLYSKNVSYKLKLEIAKMCFNFWQRVSTSHDESNSSLDFDSIMTQNFHFTLNYVFDTIKLTTKKSDMKTLSSLLREFCKVISSMSNNKKGLDLILLNLEKIMKHTMFLETETGKLTIADVYTTNQQLFLRFHQFVKKNLPKANKSEAEAYGEIYFISWINSNASMREVIEQQGIFDLISKILVLQRKGSAFRTYHYALVLLQSIQNHRKHILFSKIITNLYAPVLWRQLENENGMIRCNATEILARAYPLEKRGEGREVSSRFLITQQNALLNLMVDHCPQIRIAAIKGMCSCLRYFWDSFEEYQIIQCFNIFSRLVNESVFEVRRVTFYGFCQLLDESKSHTYFKNPLFLKKLNNTLYDENEKVRRAFIHFLLKVKKIDCQLENTEKISFAKIVNLHDVASALAREDEQNAYLLVDLIFDNFIGDKLPDKHATIMRFNMFYKINPSAFRKLIIYSDKNLDFNSACNLILSLLKAVYNGVKKKEERLKNNNKENSIPPKKLKTTDDSDNMNDTSSSCSSLVNNNEETEQNDHSNVCCILNCVYCLMILHRNKFIEEENHQKMKDIQDSCSTCLIKILKFYKEGDAYYSAMTLASFIPASKLTAHISAPSTALSALRQLPYDVKNAEEEIDMSKVDCLVFTLCMWKRGYEILQFVFIWFDEAFKTLNLSETQYPKSIMKEGKRVRFKISIEECKPQTGILLINSMLLNLQTQKTLMDSDVNKKNIYDLMTYLQRVKIAIENRISSDNVLNNLLNDEVLIDLFLLHIRLHVLYHSHEENLCIDEVIKYQTSILDWVIKDLLIYDFHQKSETTIIFAAKVIDIVNQKVFDMCSMNFINQSYLDNFFSFCTAILHNYLGPRILISLMASLTQISKYYNYLKQIDNPVNDVSKLLNCVRSIISTLSESIYNEKSFSTIIGESPKFRRTLNLLVWEIYKMNIVEFNQIYVTIIENIINVIANRIQEVDEVDLNEKLIKLPFSAYQLTMVILNNAELRKQFSSNAILVFSSNIYKHDNFLLLSAISFVYTLSFQLNHTKTINLEQVVRLLYKILIEFDKSTTHLGDNCTINNTKANQETSILETSDFSNEIMDFKKKGRDILIATAKNLHITLAE